MGKLVVISGLPASGKSTLIRELKEQYNIISVPEHNEWVKGKFPKVPENIEEKIEKQKFFLNLDIARYNWAMEHIDKAEIIISDTDFTSPLAHNYAERWLLPDFNIYDWMVDEYIEQIQNKKLGLADYYIYLDVSYENRLKRREEDFQKSGRKRNDMFFTNPFPRDMREFHYIMINNNSPRRCLPSTWYDNTKNINEAVSDLWNIISKVEKDEKQEETFNKFANSLQDTKNDEQR